MKVGRRKFRNLLIFPESQIRYGIVFLSMATFTHVALTLIVIKLYSAWGTNEGELPIGVPIWILLVGLFFLYVVIQSFALALGLFMSHKVFGPLVPIRKMIDDMNHSRPTTPLVLRKSDDPQLQELAEDLNQLARKIGNNF